MTGALCIVLALGACSFRSGSVRGSADDDAAVDDARDDDGDITDSMLADAMLDAAPAAWSTPVDLGVAAAGGDDDPTLTDDRLEMYFNRSSDIYKTTRSAIGMAWSTPAIDMQLSSASVDGTPEVSGDGLTMWLMSDRANGVGDQDIWISTRASRAAMWGMPTNAGVSLNSTGADRDAAATNDQLNVVFTRTVSTNANVFTSSRQATSVAWPAPTAITELNMPDANGGQFSQDLRTIYFTSVRAGGSDLYVASRPTVNNAFSTPALITELNSTSSDTDIWVSSDGRHTVFVSDRGGTTKFYTSSR